jgi:hypothetical protein
LRIKLAVRQQHEVLMLGVACSREYLFKLMRTGGNSAMLRTASFVLLLCLSILAHAQTGTDGFQVRYAANVTAGSDSVINITSAGSVNPSYYSTSTTPQNICVNVYAFAPDSTMAACCSCLVRPDGLASLSVYNDITGNTLTGVRPTGVVVKLLATTTPTNNPSSCTNTAGSSNLAVVSGMRAWMTTTHAAGAINPNPATTETEFAIAPLSSSERTQLASTCSSVITNGQGFGICRSCRFGGQ